MSEALEGFIDCSVLLRSGVYVLSYRGRVVYVGQSKAPITRVYAHRNLARKRPVAWLPIKGIVFDQVHVMPCHPDQINALEQELIQEFAPRYNIVHKPVRTSHLPTFSRRLEIAAPA